MTTKGELEMLTGPEGLRAPPVMADESIAGHCFHWHLKKKIFFNEADFRVIYLLFTASVQTRTGLTWTNPSPWSIHAYNHAVIGL